MKTEDVASLLRGVDVLLSLLANAGISAARVAAMREASASGHLTDEDVHLLSLSAHAAVARLDRNP